MKKLLVFIIFAGFSWLQADISEYYSPQTSYSAYTEITESQIPGISADEGIAIADIGFSFHYGNSTYTQATISSNGWIALGTGFPSAMFTNVITTSTGPIIAPLWDDLSMISGAVWCQTQGTAPNRIFVVQYHNAKWNYASTSLFNFQVKLYENSTISFCYGPSTGLPQIASASIGITLPPYGNANFYCLNLENTFTNLTEFNNISTYPGNGTVYSFVPSNYHNRNLIQNSSCEDELVNGEIPNWQEVFGNLWTRNNWVIPQDGKYHFCAGAVANAELRQDINVSAYASLIDTGVQRFKFTGFVESFSQSPADMGKIILDYLNADKQSVLYSCDLGYHTNIDNWLQVSNTSLAPAGTRFIRVRLISTRVSGVDNDGYFDHLFLDALALETLNSPSNVELACSSDQFTLSWSPVEGAYSYKIYSSPNPNGPFTFQTQTGNLFWSGTVSASCKFYRIEASTETP